MLKHKYRAIATEIDGIRFDSKLEASYYQHLKKRQAKGEIIFFLRQVPFHLPGGVKYIVDFQIFESNGSIRFIDCKGMNTPMSSLKQKQVEELYKPVKIEIVKKGDF